MYIYVNIYKNLHIYTYIYICIHLYISMHLFVHFYVLIYMCQYCQKTLNIFLVLNHNLVSLHCFLAGIHRFLSPYSCIYAHDWRWCLLLSLSLYYLSQFIISLREWSLSESDLSQRVISLREWMKGLHVQLSRFTCVFIHTCLPSSIQARSHTHTHTHTHTHMHPLSSHLPSVFMCILGFGRQALVFGFGHSVCELKERECNTVTRKTARKTDWIRT